MGKDKQAILDPRKRKSLIEACETDREFVVIWLFLNTGVHPRNLGKWTPKNLDEDDWLQWKRVKTAKPRRELLPHDVGEKVRAFLNNNFRPKNRTSLWEICRDVGLRAGIKGCSPMMLRHTFCITELERLRDHPERFDLIAIKMGCRKDTVMRNYLDLVDWETRGRR